MQFRVWIVHVIEFLSLHGEASLLVWFIVIVVVEFSFTEPSGHQGRSRRQQRVCIPALGKRSPAREAKARPKARAGENEKVSHENDL